MGESRRGKQRVGGIADTDDIRFAEARRKMLEDFDRGDIADPVDFLVGRGWEINWGREAAVRDNRRRRLATRSRRRPR